MILIEWASARVPPTPLFGGPVERGGEREREREIEREREGERKKERKIDR